MPWLETAPVEERQQFIEDYQEGFHSMSELCARYGISRKTGDKWLERFADAVGAGWPIGAERPTRVRIASATSWRNISAGRERSIWDGGRRSC